MSTIDELRAELAALDKEVDLLKKERERFYHKQDMTSAEHRQLQGVIGKIKALDERRGMLVKLIKAELRKLNPGVTEQTALQLAREKTLRHQASMVGAKTAQGKVKNVYGAALAQLGRLADQHNMVAANVVAQIVKDAFDQARKLEQEAEAERAAS